MILLLAFPAAALAAGGGESTPTPGIAPAQVVPIAPLQRPVDRFQRVVRTIAQDIRAVLRPGSPFAVLDLYDRPAGERANTASILGLFFHLTSGADTYTVEEVSRWMGETGYGSVDVKSFRTLPDLRLLVAKAV